MHIAATLPASTATSTRKVGVQAKPLQLLWAPEVLQPKSNVHYVHARANNDALRSPSERLGDGDEGATLKTTFPAISAFRLIPVQFTGSLKKSSLTSSTHVSPADEKLRSDPDSLQPPPSHQWCVMQHASSGLFISASLAPRGLMWFHESIDDAVLVRLVPSVRNPKKGVGQRFHVVLRAQPSRLSTRSASPPPVVEWIASMYAPETPQVSHDLGTVTAERRSLVLTEYRDGSIKGPTALYYFEVCVTSVPSQPLDVTQPTRKLSTRVAQSRKRDSSSDDEESHADSTSDDSTDSSEITDGSVDDDDLGTDGSRAPTPTTEAAAYDDDVSSGDEEFLELALAHRDAFSLFTRRQQVGNFFQDRCVCKRRVGGCVAYYCSPLGAEKFTVIGFGERDALVRCYRSVAVTQLNAKARWTGDPDKANCMMCTLSAGIPGHVSSCRIPVLVTTRSVTPGENFLCLASSLTKFPSSAMAPTTPAVASLHSAAAQASKFLMQHHPPSHSAEYSPPLFCDTAWYVDTYHPDPPPEAAVPLASVLPKTADGGVALMESHQPLYYYGNHASLAVPHRDAVLQFPFNLIQVRPCMRLRGELEVVAKHFIPMGTCFLYCGPKIRRKDESDKGAISTAMSIDRIGRRIKGGNIMKFVNHRFGFADEGNVAFRRGAIMYRRRHFPERGPVETHINFFIATKDIPAGELLLAEGYGPEYDSFIERIAYCGGRYLSAEERLWLTEQEMEQGPVQSSALARGPRAAPGSYAACYLSDIHIGSVVGRRCPLPTARDTKEHRSTPPRLRRRLEGSSSLYADTAAEDGHELGASRVAFYRVTAITDDNVLLGEELEHEFPYLFDRYPDGTGATVPHVAVLRKTEAILFIPGWDYEDAILPAEILLPSATNSGAHSTVKLGGDGIQSNMVKQHESPNNIGWCARLKMPKEALDRGTYADLVREAPAGGASPP
jgi:hypothetical protein